MPSAIFTGALGWTDAGPHPFQAGGPPLIQSYARATATGAGAFGLAALPLVAHLYGNDGVTANTTTATFDILNRPDLSVTLANGGYDQITLEVDAPIAAVALGNVIRLTEAGGPYAGFVYSGIVEGLPDVLGPNGPMHQIVLTPFGFELLRVASTQVYLSPVDASQVFREAVAQTQHCSCDQISVPPATGILISPTAGGQVDFRGQKLNQVLEQVRSVLGAAWFWHCDEGGRCWLQAQGSAAAYTLMQGRHYQDRTSTADITSRVNQVVAIGGVPAGGSANVTATYNGSSQSTLGIRSLDPPIQLPGISDTATIQAIANGIGATLDQTWNRVSLTVLPTLAQRVHASQPGGAMVRYWEPTRYPYPESEVGAGYVGPFIGQSVDSDGLTQRITAGNIPITSSVDINNMVASWAARAAAITQQITGAALNLNQTLTGSLQSGTGTLAPGGARATLWSLGQQEFAAIDENGVARAEMGDLAANGISPAQWGFRANAAAGSPIFDSQGLIAVMSVLGSFTEAAVVNLTSLTPVVVNGTVTVTFSLARAANVLVTMQSTADVTTSGARAGASGQIYFDGTAHGPTARWDTANGFVLAAPAHFRNLAAGSHTVDFRVNVDNALCTWVNFQTTLDVFLLGS